MLNFTQLTYSSPPAYTTYLYYLDVVVQAPCSPCPPCLLLILLTLFTSAHPAYTVYTNFSAHTAHAGSLRSYYLHYLPYNSRLSPFPVPRQSKRHLNFKFLVWQSNTTGCFQLDRKIMILACDIAKAGSRIVFWHKSSLEVGTSKT